MPQIPPREKLIGVNRREAEERNGGMDNLTKGKREEKANKEVLEPDTGRRKQ